ncbi:translational machinery component [Acephala macrosclerotiorum]|nr:translational machinery component [Acephala macrosclerotiorum]
MSRTASRRLLAQSPLTLLSESSYRLPMRCLRSFSTTPRRRADDDKSKPVPFTSAAFQPRTQAPTAPPISPSLNPKSASSSMNVLSNILKATVFEPNQAARRQGRLPNTNSSSDGSSSGLPGGSAEPGSDTSWQLHIYATRHNVHITVVRPPGWVHPQTGRRYPKAPHNNRTVALSLAAGNLGFRKSGRKHYDSAFQLASYVMGRMQESGMNAWIETLEVYLRGFGAGREAVTKALLGTEGRFLKRKVIKVSDATRLKFGGTRSKKPRRLG